MNMKITDEEKEKKFDDALDELQIYCKIYRSELKKTRSEEFIVKATNNLIEAGKVYIFMRENALKFGSTWPIFEDSYIFPDHHMVQITVPNLIVLTHELAHVYDFDRKSNDFHDEIFFKIWRGLCMQILGFVTDDDIPFL